MNYRGDMKGKKNFEEATKLLQEQKFKEALNQFNKAIVLEPNNPNYYSDRAIAFFYLELAQEALKDLNKAVSLDPKYSYRYSSRAFIKAALKDYEGAKLDYRMCIELDPEDAIAYNNLGLIEENEGRKNEAQQLYSKADELTKIQNGNGKVEPQPQQSITETPAPAPIVEEKPTEEKENKESFTSLIKQVFTNKDTFKEFIQFIKKGFKL